MSNISRRAYADMFGPTVGDKVRGGYRAVDRGGGRFDHLRGRGQIRRRQSDPRRHGRGQMLAADCVDTVLTNALIVDHWGSLRPISA